MMTQTIMEEIAENTTQHDEVKNTGRGFIVITIAKIWFMVTGATIQLGLPILFDTAADFGIFKIITEAVSLLNMVVIAGTLQAVSKLASEKPEQANNIMKLALKVQFGVGIPIALAYVMLSPQIASFFNDTSLVALLRLSGLIIFAYAFYAIFVGYLNGRKMFVRQATLDIVFATLKTVGILGAVMAGLGVVGAVGGFVGAALVIVIIAGLWTMKIARTEGAKEALASGTTKRLLSYLFIVMLYTFGLNALMRADLFALKKIVGEIPMALAGWDFIFKMISDKFAGLYGAVLNISRIPYQGVIAITFVIFPLISASTFVEDHDATRRYIISTLRYCLLLITSVAFLLILNADSIIAGLYAAEYQAASGALMVLSISIIFFAILFVTTTMIIGAGRPIAAVIIMTISFALSAILNWKFITRVHSQVSKFATDSLAVLPIPENGSPQDLVAHAVQMSQRSGEITATYLQEAPNYMQSASYATLIAMGTGCFLSLAFLWKQFDALPPLKTMIRILVLFAVLFGIDYLIPTPLTWLEAYGKIVFLGIVALKMALMGLVYLFGMWVLREFSADDIAKVKAILDRKKKKIS